MVTVTRTAWCMALLLAGCTTTAPPAQEEPLGAVAGVVVTPAIEPIGGAWVRLAASGLEAQSDVFGRFRFDGLEPGVYRLNASAPGHVAGEVSVTVDTGQTARPRVVLPHVPVPPVDHETHEFQGFFPAWLGPADEPATPAKEALGLRCTCVFEVPAPEALVAITVEAVWQDSLQRQEASTAFRWNVTMEAATAQGAGASPLHAHVLASEVGPLNGTHAQIAIFPDETWPTYDQSFQLFVTTWQTEEPEPAWSRVRGDP